MWILDFFIGRKLHFGCFQVYCGSKVSWIGFIYFTILIIVTSFACRYQDPAIASTIHTGRNNTEFVGLFNKWLICCIPLRILDLIYATYTGIRRYIDPRKRAPFLIISMIARIGSFLGGILITAFGIFILVVKGIPDSRLHLQEAAFYLNFIPLVIIYGILAVIVFTPCGWACCCICYCCICKDNCGSCWPTEDSNSHRHMESNIDNDWRTCIDVLKNAFSSRDRNDDMPSQHNNRQVYHENNVVEAPINRMILMHPRNNEFVVPVDPGNNVLEAPVYPAPNAPQKSIKNRLKGIQWIKWKELLAADDIDCVICYQMYKPDHKLAKLPCGHYFHQDCSIEWLQKNNTCPICRQVVSAATKDLHVMVRAEQSVDC